MTEKFYLFYSGLWEFIEWLNWKWLSENPSNQLEESRNKTRSNLDNVPKIHEGEAEEEAKGATELGHKGFQTVDQLLLLYQ